MDGRDGLGWDGWDGMEGWMEWSAECVLCLSCSMVSGAPHGADPIWIDRAYRIVSYRGTTFRIVSENGREGARLGEPPKPN